MIWPVPLLRSADLAHWFSSGIADLPLPTGFVSSCWHHSGAAALAGICAQLAAERGRPINILLPGYFCGQSLRYLRQLPVRMHFYSLTRELLPDYEAIRQLPAAESIDILVHVHYFGRIAGQQLSRAFADELGALLIEDCAHVISPLVHRDWLGDYLVFAPHKLFPLPRVGLAIGRQPLAESSAEQGAALPYGWLLRQAARCFVKKAPPALWERVWSDEASEFDAGCPGALVTRAVSASLAGFEPAATARKANALHLQAKLAPAPGWVPFGAGDEATVPYLLGMLCDSPERARRRFELLNRRSRLVMQWPDLPSEIRDLPLIAGQCGAWADQALFFFVHQQLGPGTWLEEIERALRGGEFQA